MDSFYQSAGLIQYWLVHIGMVGWLTRRGLKMLSSRLRTWREVLGTAEKLSPGYCKLGLEASEQSATNLTPGEISSG